MSYPRLHFFIIAQAPLFAECEGERIKLNVQVLTDEMWWWINFLANVKREDGKYICALCSYGCVQVRGKIEKKNWKKI